MGINLWEFRIGKHRPIYELILWYMRCFPGTFLKEYLRFGVIGHTDRFTLYTNYDGITFDLDLADFLQKMIFCFQYYEHQYVKICKRLIPRGGIVMDVGANIGQYALLASKLAGSEGYVYAFEPGESLLLTLRRNIVLNASNNIEVLPVAVGNDKGRYSYYPPSSTDNQGTGSLIHDPTGKSRSTTPIQVNMVRLDDFCEERKINNVDFIKIDVEGFDLEVLKGSRTILLNNPRVVVMVELADDNLKAMGIGANDIRQFMLDLKFQMYKVTGTGRLLMTSRTEELKSCNGFFMRG